MFLCSEFSSPCQASRAIFKPSLPINPSSFLTDGGWGGGGVDEGRVGKRNKEGRKKKKKTDKERVVPGVGGLGVLTNIHA